MMLPPEQQQQVYQQQQQPQTMLPPEQHQQVYQQQSQTMLPAVQQDQQLYQQQQQPQQQQQRVALPPEQQQQIYAQNQMVVIPNEQQQIYQQQILPPSHEQQQQVYQQPVHAEQLQPQQQVYQQPVHAEQLQQQQQMVIPQEQQVPQQQQQQPVYQQQISDPNQMVVQTQQPMIIPQEQQQQQHVYQQPMENVNVAAQPVPPIDQHPPHDQPAMETTSGVPYAYSQDTPDIDASVLQAAAHDMVAGALALDATNRHPPSPLSIAEIPVEAQDQDIEIQEEDEQNSSLYNTGDTKDVSDHHHQLHRHHPPPGLSTINYKTSNSCTLSSSNIFQDHPGYIIQDNPSLHVVQPSTTTAQYPNPKTVYLHHPHQYHQSSLSLDGSQQHYQHQQQQQQLSHKDAAAQFRKSSVPNATQQIQFHAEALLRRGSLPPLPSAILLVKTSAGSSGQGTPSSSAGSTLSSVASTCMSEPLPFFSPEKMSAAPPNMSRRSSSGAITPLATLKEKATDSDISLEDLSQVKSAAFL